MNPFNESPISLFDAFRNWKELYPRPYNKYEVDPYTKARIILMNGAESEASRFSHAFSRQTSDVELRRELAFTRALEGRQQQQLSLLKPGNESILEHTVSYEQLAVDLTAELAKRETDSDVKSALDFALLEDFDHLYRFSDLLNLTKGVPAETLVGGYTEIMPGRPTIAHHRYPKDNVKAAIPSSAQVQTVLGPMIITAAEQQTMNFYMNVASLAKDNLSRRLYEEIALVEEEHVTQYECLTNAELTMFEKLLWHEYNECYLYYSCYTTETDKHVKSIWEENLAIEIAHLHKAAELLEKYEDKHFDRVIPNGEFPPPITLHENIEYVRSVLGENVHLTCADGQYVDIKDLPQTSEFFRYQDKIQPTAGIVPSHNVIDEHISRQGRDYRYETKESPVPQLRSTCEDNTDVGRVPNAADK